MLRRIIFLAVALFVVSACGPNCGYGGYSYGGCYGGGMYGGYGMGGYGMSGYGMGGYGMGGYGMGYPGYGYRPYGYGGMYPYYSVKQQAATQNQTTQQAQ